VRVDVTAINTSNVGIQNGANANLSIVGGEVRPTTSGQNITLINAVGVLTVTGLTVDMTGHTKASTGILLQLPGSLVTGSTISIGNPSSGNAIGINVQGTASKSNVVGNTFTASGQGIGVNGNNNLSPSAAPPNNTFSGTFTNEVVP
jgi:hypothetical protein